MKRQSAVFVAVPVGDLVDDFRARHHPRAIARKLPPHVTIVPPFTRDVDADEALGAELAAHFSSCEGFEGSLVGVGRFRRHRRLAPAPDERCLRADHVDPRPVPRTSSATATATPCPI